MSFPASGGMWLRQMLCDVGGGASLRLHHPQPLLDGTLARIVRM